VRQVLINGFKSAFVPYREKGDLLRQALEEIDEQMLRARIHPTETERDLL